MADKVITSTGDCSACCEPPADCSCALLIPPFAAPYADYATALAVVDGSGADEKADCYAYIISTAGITSFSSDVTTANHLILNGDGTIAASEPLTVWGSITGQAGDTLSIDWTLPDGDGDSGFWYQVYSCDGTLIEEGGGLGTSGTITLSATLPSDGVYYISVGSELDPTPPSPATFSVTADIYSDNPVLAPNPVIALWDDSGTTRRLWACPKLLLPPLTESTGDWYVDCAEAADVITDFTSNCTGYFEPDAGVDSFSVVGGGALNFVLGASGTASTTGPMWGSFTADAGDIISVAQNGDPGDITAILYDYTGTLVENFSGTGTSGVASSALPYTGRYIIMVNVVFPPPSAPFTSLNVDVTSDGAFDVHTIQALYDSSLTCPSRLNCGDSC